jgi:hypothetical protein
METAAALREGRIGDIDLVATAEEIEDLGKAERRRLHTALVQIFTHLLKKEISTATRDGDLGRVYQDPAYRYTRYSRGNPSLGPVLQDPRILQKAYRNAVWDAVLQTGLPEETFPTDRPFTVADTKVSPKRRKR